VSVCHSCPSLWTDKSELELELDASVNPSHPTENIGKKAKATNYRLKTDNSSGRSAISH